MCDGSFTKHLQECGMYRFNGLNTILDKDEKVRGDHFPNRIPAHPPPNLRPVLAHLVLVQPRHGTPGLGAEAVGEGRGEVA